MSVRVFKAATDCKSPMRWEPPACSSVRQRSRWSCGCTRSWACRWRRSRTCCGRTQFGIRITPGGLAACCTAPLVKRRADLLGVVPAGAEQPRGHTGRDRLARRRSPPLAVGLRHADDDGLCDSCRSRLRRCGDGSRDFSGVLVRDGWARRIVASPRRCTRHVWLTCSGEQGTCKTTTHAADGSSG